MDARDKSPAIEPRVRKEGVLLSWNARSRPFKRFPREFYINLGAVAVLFGLILFVIEGIIPAILVASLYFIFYVFTNYEPGTVDYQLTTYGVKIEEHRIGWNFLGRYSFTKKFDHDILIFETFEAPWRLELVVDETKKQQAEDIVSQYLYLNDSPPTHMDKATEWVASRLRF